MRTFNDASFVHERSPERSKRSDDGDLARILRLGQLDDTHLHVTLPSVEVASSRSHIVPTTAILLGSFGLGSLMMRTFMACSGHAHDGDLAGILALWLLDDTNLHRDCSFGW
jgi:hypothetical protein